MFVDEIEVLQKFGRKSENLSAAAAKLSRSCLRCLPDDAMLGVLLCLGREARDQRALLHNLLQVHLQRKCQAKQE